MFKNNINHNSLLLNEAYLINDEHILRNMEHFLIKLRAFYNNTASIFCPVRGQL